MPIPSLIHDKGVAYEALRWRDGEDLGILGADLRKQLGKVDPQPSKNEPPSKPETRNSNETRLKARPHGLNQNYSPETDQIHDDIGPWYLHEGFEVCCSIITASLIFSDKSYRPPEPETKKHRNAKTPEP